jgi:hypothetical protein
LFSLEESNLRLCCCCLRPLPLKKLPPADRPSCNVHAFIGIVFHRSACPRSASAATRSHLPSVFLHSFRILLRPPAFLILARLSITSITSVISIIVTPQSFFASRCHRSGHFNPCAAQSNSAATGNCPPLAPFLAHKSKLKLFCGFLFILNRN